MSALDRILMAARENGVSMACQWINFTGVHDPRQPQVSLILDDVRWSVHFTKGKVSWLFKSAATSNRQVITLTAVLELIAAEGERRDRAEREAADALAAQIAWEQSQERAS